MFVDDGKLKDDGSDKEGTAGKLDYDEFLKCLKSYHNFLDLWWRMRVDFLSELIKS